MGGGGVGVERGPLVCVCVCVCVCVYVCFYILFLCIAKEEREWGQLRGVKPGE